MTPAGRRVELARYRISTGTRGLYAQRIDGRVAVVDVPIDHPDHVHLVERHVHTKAELAELAADGLARGRARVTGRRARGPRRRRAGPPAARGQSR